MRHAPESLCGIKRILHFWLGILLYDLGDYAEACKAFKKELEIMPSFRDAAWELGSACSKLGLVNELIEAYQTALDIDPCCIQALFGLGNVYLRQGNYTEAIEFYEDALFISPELDHSALLANDEDVKSMVASIYINLGFAWILQKNPNKAQESFRNCQKIKTNGILYEFADSYLGLLTELSDKMDSVDWKIIDFPLEGN